jgi:hypothetical protein
MLAVKEKIPPSNVLSRKENGNGVEEEDEAR